MARRASRGAVAVASLGTGVGLIAAGAKPRRSAVKSGGAMYEWGNKREQPARTRQQHEFHQHTGVARKATRGGERSPESAPHRGDRVRTASSTSGEITSSARLVTTQRQLQPLHSASSLKNVLPRRLGDLDRRLGLRSSIVGPQQFGSSVLRSMASRRDSISDASAPNVEDDLGQYRERVPPRRTYRDRLSGEWPLLQSRFDRLPRDLTHAGS
jgi:hypothetical protein